MLKQEPCAGGTAKLSCACDVLTPNWEETLAATSLQRSVITAIIIATNFPSSCPNVAHAGRNGSTSVHMETGIRQRPFSEVNLPDHMSKHFYTPQIVLICFFSSLTAFLLTGLFMTRVAISPDQKICTL